MAYSEYLIMIDTTENAEELESILKLAENDETISARKYEYLRYIVIKKIYR